MPIDRYALVDRFGSALERGAGALFIGAGLSIQAKLPSWGALLEDLLKERNLEGIADLPLAAEYFEQDPAGGRQRLQNHMLEKLGATQVPSPSHRIIAQLNVRAVWTTNYDTLLETSQPQAFVAASDSDAQKIGASHPAIIKMHGSMQTRPSLAWVGDRPVITRGDFERYEAEHPRTWSLLRATYLTQTLLFLGFSFTDPNIEVLQRLARQYKTSQSDNHVAVLRKPRGEQELRHHNLRVTDLELNGVAVCEIDDFDEIEPLLRALRRRTRDRRIFVSGSGKTEDVKSSTGEIARALEDELSWTIASLGGDAGWGLSLALANLRRPREVYSPDQTLMYFRRKPGEPAPSLDDRVGTAIFTDLERVEMANEVLDDCRAMLVIQGGPRTLEEVAWAEAKGIGVVPLAASGGSAQTAWERQPTPPLLGGIPADQKDWNLLTNRTAGVAASAAVRLLRQAMYQLRP